MTNRTFIIHPHFKSKPQSVSRSPEACLEEATGLAAAIDLAVAEAMIVTIAEPKPATLFGSGKVEELAGYIAHHEAELAIINTHVSPVQQRNLEKAWNCKVIDRTALILEIFGARARTHEGKLQVELAALSYQKSRLVRSWTHLERQRGGFGFLGGPGESQIEIDRRLIRDQIAKLKRQLEQVKKTRNLHRKSRRDVPFPVVALVGYTNAGKSTLFNRLTGADVLSMDKLFATLDPTMRGLVLPAGGKVILSDTVGFVSDLPTELVAAFRATLEEVLEADILLHVRDISHPDTTAQKQDVEQVLKSLFSSEQLPENIIEVCNKIDLLPAPSPLAGEGWGGGCYPSIEQEDATPLLNPPPQGGRNFIFVDDGAKIYISAASGEGIPALLARIEDAVTGLFFITKTYELPAENGKAIAWLHAHGKVIKQTLSDDEKTIRITAQLSAENASRFTTYHSI